MVSSEGAAIETPSASARLVMEAQTRAGDGMDLLRVETFQAPAVSGLPSEAVLMAKAEKMAADLKELRKAPVAEPYDGPALLSGRQRRCFFTKCWATGWKGTGNGTKKRDRHSRRKLGRKCCRNF